MRKKRGPAQRSLTWGTVGIVCVVGLLWIWTTRILLLVGLIASVLCLMYGFVGFIQSMRVYGPDKGMALVGIIMGVATLVTLILLVTVFPSHFQSIVSN
ncbi:MAG: hypothetical protein ACOYI4_02575 [Christensenellales bacterium]|jgi:hypothetical protein